MATFLEKQIAKTALSVARWNGHPVRMLELTRSHSTLVILVGDEEYGKNLYIACLEPHYVQGPTRWKSAQVQLVPAVLETGQEGIALIDEAQCVRILAESFEVKENVKW